MKETSVTDLEKAPRRKYECASCNRKDVVDSPRKFLTTHAFWSMNIGVTRVNPGI